MSGFGPTNFDTLANAVEFVIGGNPATASDSALLPTQSTVTTDLGAGSTSYLKFTFRRIDSSAYLAPSPSLRRISIAFMEGNLSSNDC